MESWMHGDNWNCPFIFKQLLHLFVLTDFGTQKLALPRIHPLRESYIKTQRQDFRNYAYARKIQMQAPLFFDEENFLIHMLFAWVPTN